VTHDGPGHGIGSTQARMIVVSSGLIAHEIPKTRILVEIKL
jgi:hypothetical protein